jgi:DNA-binding MarR family transcriptional regulator
VVEELNEASRAHSTATVLFHAAMAEQFGLSSTDSKAMDVVARFGPLTAGELVERTGLASPSVTALIDRLEAKGLVRRVRDTEDRRRVIVELVPEGIAPMARRFDDLKTDVQELWAPYTLHELEVILDFLKRSAEFVASRTTRMAAEAAARRAKQEHQD